MEIIEADDDIESRRIGHNESDCGGMGDREMCLAIPGRVIRWIERDTLAGTAEIEFGAVRRVCHMACVPTAAAGDFVIVHAGVAISIMDTAEADRVLQELTAVTTATMCGEPARTARER